MEKVNFSGAITALVTPFNEDKTVDFSALKRLINFQLENGISGLALCATTGESATLKPEEYSEIIKTAVKEVRGKILIIAGAGANDTQKAIHLSRMVREAGADGLLIVSPYYNKPTPAGLVAHYQAIAEAVDLPIILYNVPSRTGSNVLPRTVLRIVQEVPQVVGIKEASGSLEQIVEILIGKPKHFVVLSGEDSLTLPIMLLGGKGCISVVANEVPREFSQLCQSALEGDWERAREIHFQLWKLMKANFIETNPLPVKTALAMMGKIKEVFRLPLCPMEEKNKEILRQTLKELNLI